MAANTTTVIEKDLSRFGGLKFTLVLAAALEKPNPGTDDNVKPDVITTIAFLRSKVETVLNSGEIMQRLADARTKIINSLEEFTSEGSGWRLKRCEDLLLGIARYQPFRGRSYIKTPTYIPPRTVINVRNQDNRCFEWAILSAVYPVGSKDHPDRPTKYQDHFGELDFAGIGFPVKVTDVTKFERQNPTLSVNVFGWKSGPYPIHVSKQVGIEIDLLLLTDTRDTIKTHYVWIKDLPRLMNKNSTDGHRPHPCRRCLHVFSSEVLLKKHRKDCLRIGEKPQRTGMPEEGKNILKFANHHKQMRVPFIIYADYHLCSR